MMKFAKTAAVALLFGATALTSCKKGSPGTGDVEGVQPVTPKGDTKELKDQYKTLQLVLGGSDKATLTEIIVTNASGKGVTYKPSTDMKIVFKYDGTELVKETDPSKITATSNAYRADAADVFTIADAGNNANTQFSPVSTGMIEVIIAQGTEILAPAAAAKRTNDLMNGKVKNKGFAFVQ